MAALTDGTLNSLHESEEVLFFLAGLQQFNMYSDQLLHLFRIHKQPCA